MITIYTKVSTQLRLANEYLVEAHEKRAFEVAANFIFLDILFLYSLRLLKIVVVVVVGKSERCENIV